MTVLLGLTGTAGAASAVPGSAATANAEASAAWSCARGYVCLYTDVDGEGPVLLRKRGNDCGIWFLGARFHDKASSVRNRTGKVISLFNGVGPSDNGGPVPDLQVYVRKVAPGAMINLNGKANDVVDWVLIPC